ncbi:MAG TPA: cupin domain-containing protein [Kribbella sp.]|nr:cupin domain-containing protein [Kribbella sp.]
MDKPELATLLDLEPHPEGGWFRETWRSEVEFAPPGYGGARASATAIYFLLGPGEESQWHRVRSAEIWLWHSGGPLTLTYGETPEVAEAVTLGPDVATGQQPQVVIPAGAWQAARPTGPEAVLVSCVVSPGFDYADFTLLPAGQPTDG